MQALLRDIRTLPYSFDLIKECARKPEDRTISEFLMERVVNDEDVVKSFIQVFALRNFSTQDICEICAELMILKGL